MTPRNAGSKRNYFAVEWDSVSGYQYGIITVEDFIHCGLRLRLGAVRTLRLYREMGGKIRTREFMERWRTEQNQLTTQRAAASGS